MGVSKKRLLNNLKPEYSPVWIPNNRKQYPHIHPRVLKHHAYKPLQQTVALSKAADWTKSQALLPLPVFCNIRKQVPHLLHTSWKNYWFTHASRLRFKRHRSGPISPIYSTSARGSAQVRPACRSVSKRLCAAGESSHLPGFASPQCFGKTFYLPPLRI